MKKLLILALTLCMVLTVAACGSGADKDASDDMGASAARQTESVDKPEESEATDALSPESEPTEVDETAETGDTSEGKTLVAYFSCTGNTKGVAEKIASELGADIYEIVPEEPYTDADLDYNDSSTRATREQGDDSCRPAISGSVENMEGYETVFIGYPIWWGQAPKIMYTFMESYDFAGKTVVPFCTSGSSGIGPSVENLAKSAPDANWLDGRRFSGGASDNDIESWLNGLDLE